MDFLRLVLRNLLRHKIRTLLTVASLAIALLLLCTLRSLITTIGAGAQVASARRIIVQSAVSLFVDLPLAYESRIASVPGVALVSKWQWFGGYYQEPRNQFPQFAISPETFFEMYPEVRIVDGSAQGFLDERRGCLIGAALARRYGWKIGDTVPLIPTIFPHPDGPDVPWEFRVSAIYESTQASFDETTLLFHWDYFEKTVEQGVTGTPGVGIYILLLAPDAEAQAVMSDIDALYANGPQRVQSTTEAEFQKQFVSMLGSVPFFLSAIGGAVLAAILLATVNTMLMSAREQVREIGILKALGFTDAWTAVLLVAQGLFLCAVGGGIGVFLAKALEPSLTKALGTTFPGYAVLPQTVALGVAVTLGVGLVAGLLPAWTTARLRCIDALGATE